MLSSALGVIEDTVVTVGVSNGPCKELLGLTEDVITEVDILVLDGFLVNTGCDDIAIR